MYTSEYTPDDEFFTLSRLSDVFCWIPTSNPSGSIQPCCDYCTRPYIHTRLQWTMSTTVVGQVLVHSDEWQEQCTLNRLGQRSNSHRHSQTCSLDWGPYTLPTTPTMPHNKTEYLQAAVFPNCASGCGCMCMAACTCVSDPAYENATFILLNDDFKRELGALGSVFTFQASYWHYHNH